MPDGDSQWGKLNNKKTCQADKGLFVVDYVNEISNLDLVKDTKEVVDYFKAN